MTMVGENVVDSMGPSTSTKASLSWIGVAGEKVTQMTIKKSGALLLLAFSWIGMRGTKKEEPLAGTRATEDMPPCKTISGVTRNKQNQEKIPEKLQYEAYSTRVYNIIASSRLEKLLRFFIIQVLTMADGKT